MFIFCILAKKRKLSLSPSSNNGKCKRFFKQPIVALATKIPVSSSLFYLKGCNLDKEWAKQLKTTQMFFSSSPLQAASLLRSQFSQPRLLSAAFPFLKTFLPLVPRCKMTTCVKSICHSLSR